MQVRKEICRDYLGELRQKGFVRIDNIYRELFIGYCLGAGMQVGLDLSGTIVYLKK